jgi:hypothetical protein
MTNKIGEYEQIKELMQWLCNVQQGFFLNFPFEML